MLNLSAMCAFGLESTVARELEALGYSPTVQHGEVQIAAPIDAIARCNIWLRCAERVVVRIGTFSVPDFDALYEHTQSLPWHEWLPVNGAFPVRGRTARSQLSSLPACQRTVKKAIVESLRANYRTDCLPENGPTVPVTVTIVNDVATLAIDTSGVGLHKRGYRLTAGAAPLRETVAAGLVLLSYWQADRTLLDPFCGSGTIPIEAALIGRNIAPGLRRTFAAESWSRVPDECWQQARSDAHTAIRSETSDLTIVGSDQDADIIRCARENAQRAGVDTDIEFIHRPFSELDHPAAHGCLVTNPPYGERLDDAQTVETLYREMPNVLRRFPTWSHYILTANSDFETLVGHVADRRRKLYNARLACTYYQFYGPKAGTAGRCAFGQRPDGTSEQAAQFRRRLEKRARHLRRWPRNQGIHCYRLYDRDVPGVPLIVDRYDRYVHVCDYPTHRHTSAEHGNWLEHMVEVIGDVLDTDRADIFVKQRQRQSGNRQHQRVADEKSRVVVEEGGLKFWVNLTDYIDTGLFLDHRITRGLVRDIAAGRRFLNLFAYTGAFTVYAAAGGATTTTTVDRSRTYLRWAEANMNLNGFDDQTAHRYCDSDALTFLNTDTGQYDLAIVDPPTFSNRKGVESVWDVQRDHGQLLALLMPRMAPGGVIYFSTNFRKFKLDAEVSNSMDIREISRQTVPPDFKNPHVHRCWRLSVPSLT